MRAVRLPLAHPSYHRPLFIDTSRPPSPSFWRRPVHSVATSFWGPAFTCPLQTAVSHRKFTLILPPFKCALGMAPSSLTPPARQDGKLRVRRAQSNLMMVFRRREFSNNRITAVRDFNHGHCRYVVSATKSCAASNRFFLTIVFKHT